MSNQKETIIDGKAVIIDEGAPEPPVDDQEQNQTGSAPNSKPAPDADEDDEEDEEFFGKRIWRKTPKWLKVGLGLAAAAGVGFLLGGAVMNHKDSDDEDNDREDEGLFIESDDEPLEIGSYEEPSNSYVSPTPETVVEE